VISHRTTRLGHIGTEHGPNQSNLGAIEIRRRTSNLAASIRAMLRSPTSASGPEAAVTLRMIG